jgi:hypothetical protein
MLEEKITIENQTKNLPLSVAFTVRLNFALAHRIEKV